MRAFCLTWLLATLLALSGGCQSFRERSAKEKSLADVAAADRPELDAVVRGAVARIVTIRPGFLKLGSGCVVTSDGWILTAEHVVRGQRTAAVETADGRTYDGQVVALSGGNDYALLKIDARDLKYFQLGHRPALGSRVIALGTPTKWVSPNASVGQVIYPRVRIPGENGTYYFDAIFHSAPIFPGDSGGPLVDMDGNLIGVHGGFASENASVAAASVEVMRALPGGGKRRLTMDMFVPDGYGGDPDGPLIWPAYLPRDFAESSAWTVGSVEETLVEVFTPRDPELVRKVLRDTRDRYVELRANDGRTDDELVRAMLAEVFKQLDERSRAARQAAQGPAESSQH